MSVPVTMYYSAMYYSEDMSYECGIVIAPVPGKIVLMVDGFEKMHRINSD
jgi:hypothetical protein